MNRGGRPKAPLILSDDERQKLETWATRPKSTQRLATRARIVLACAEGLDNTDGRRPAPRQPRDRRQVAEALRRATASRAWPTSRGPAPRARSPTRRRAGRHQDPGGEAQGRHPLEHPRHGRGRRPVAVGDRPDLAGLRAEAPPERDLQALDRPLLRREGPRRRRAVHEPAGATPSSCRSTRRARCRPWTAPSRCCR